MTWRPRNGPSSAARSAWAVSGWAALLVLGLAAPFFVYPVFAMNVLCLALFASAFNLLLGYAGLLSFGHAAFLGMAGYVTGQAVKTWGWPVELGILAGTAAAAGLGFVFGALAIRRSGIPFAMITLGFAQLVYYFVLHAAWTGGEDGLQGVPRGKALGLVSLQGNYASYYFIFALFLAGFAVFYRTIHSPFGHVLRAIRENAPRAESLGYDVDRYRVLAFVISAGLAGLAGSMKAIVFQSATLSDVHWHRSGSVVLMALLGGMGTPIGPSVGALLVVTLENYLSGYGSWVTVITGGVFIACVLAFRRGLVGELKTRFRNRAPGPGS
jgi:branched-chain amino acid transport system permease protein